jgi:hypothetical protein
LRYSRRCLQTWHFIIVKLPILVLMLNLQRNCEGLVTMHHLSLLTQPSRYHHQDNFSNSMSLVSPTPATGIGDMSQQPSFGAFLEGLESPRTLSSGSRSQTFTPMKT